MLQDEIRVHERERFVVQAAQVVTVVPDIRHAIRVSIDLVGEPNHLGRNIDADDPLEIGRKGLAETTDSTPEVERRGAIDVEAERTELVHQHRNLSAAGFQKAAKVPAAAGLGRVGENGPQRVVLCVQVPECLRLFHLMKYPATRHGPIFWRVGMSGLLVVFGRLLQVGVGRKVVLNPELRAGGLQKLVEGGSGGACLLGVELERRDAIERALFRIVVEIAAQHDASGFGKLHVQHLMSGRMPGSRLDDDGAVAEDVVVVSPIRIALLARKPP